MAHKDGAIIDVEATPVSYTHLDVYKRQGIGIPESEQERVFERFYRVDKSHSDAVPGTGLGLSIVKHGAMVHRAKITVESTVGKGTSVEIRFPH